MNSQRRKKIVTEGVLAEGTMYMNSLGSNKDMVDLELANFVALTFYHILKTKEYCEEINAPTKTSVS